MFIRSLPDEITVPLIAEQGVGVSSKEPFKSVRVFNKTGEIVHWSRFPLQDHNSGEGDIRPNQYTILDFPSGIWNVYFHSMANGDLDVEVSKESFSDIPQQSLQASELLLQLQSGGEDITSVDGQVTEAASASIPAGTFEELLNETLTQDTWIETISIMVDNPANAFNYSWKLIHHSGAIAFSVIAVGNGSTGVPVVIPVHYRFRNTQHAIIEVRHAEAANRDFSAVVIGYLLSPNV